MEINIELKEERRIIIAKGFKLVSSSQTRLLSFFFVKTIFVNYLFFVY